MNNQTNIFVGKNPLGTAIPFSTTSQSSTADQISPPNKNGDKFIIMAKVVTGDYCKGNSSCKTIPYKPASRIDCYDSIVDDISNPTLFGVFHDTAAYPEYIIRFREVPIPLEDSEPVQATD